MIRVVFCFYCICLTSAIVEVVSDYIVNNEKCQLPNFPPFSDELKPIVKILPPANCSVRDLLTYTSVENNTAYLHINAENVNQYYDENEMVNCVFCYVRRNGTAEEPDTGISNSTCTFFNSTVKLEENTISVKCTDDRTRTVYQNVHELVTVSNSIHHRLHKLTKTLKTQNKKALSVLFVVIDGISRISFGRNMPKTKEFLLDNDFSEFFGYSKIDDNTLPNFNALLTGLDMNHTRSICKPGVTGQLDFCPMIWYDFKKHGYVTAYAEDWAYLNTYGHNGFKNPPTDFYFKPYFEAAAKLGTVKVDTAPYCTGPETEGDRTLNLARDFTSTFKNQPNFGIFWMNTFSHNHINSPSRFDDKMRRFFEDLKNNGIFNNTLILLLSDHGVRNGRIRLTRQGWYEERLPNNFISVPPWFKHEYPEKYVNLKLNSKQFTSTFDVYMTLQDALSMAVDDYKVKPSQGCPTCMSLFSRIPEVRSCSEAGVSEEWCTCLGLLENNHPDLTDEVKKNTLDFINISNIISDFKAKIKDLVSFRMTYFHKHAYGVVTVQSNFNFYLIVLKGSENPIKFDKILNLIAISKSDETFNYI